MKHFSKPSQEETIDHLVVRLQKARVFSTSAWAAHDFQQYEKHIPTARIIVKRAKKLYCDYTLYQSLCQNRPPLNNNPIIVPPNSLRRLALREGFNLCSLVYSIGLWMSDYCVAGNRDTINTLYIVGDPSSDAEMFCQSLLKIFYCVLTADINRFDIKEFADLREITKLIYFPLFLHDQPFKNPFVNQLLGGYPVHVPKDGEIYSIEPIKCLVRLKSLPRPDQLPTNPRQHVVIQFSDNGRGQMWSESELGTYIHRLKEEEDEIDFKCKNPYGVLCSSHDCIDSMCHVCSTASADLTSLTGAA
nr:MAG: hypothetical protein [Otus scops adenovirus]